MKKKLGALWASLLTATAMIMAVLGLSFVNTGAFAAIEGSVTGSSNISAATLSVSGGETGQVKMMATEGMGVPQINLTMTGPADQEGLDLQGEGNSFWVQLQTRPDAEGAMAAIGSSKVLYAEQDTLNNHKVIFAQAGGMFI